MTLTRRAALAAATAAAAGVAASARAAFGQTAPPPERRTAIVASSREIISFDPHLAAAPGAASLTRNAYEGLVRLTSMGLAPGLARSWRREGDELAFELDPRARFQSGAPVDAAAVRYSFQRLLRVGGGVGRLLAGALTPESVRAPEPGVVRIAPARPYAALLPALSQAAIVDPALVEANLGRDDGRSWLRNHLAGSGPYMVARAEPEAQIDFELDADYWRGADGAPDSVIWRMNQPSAAQRLTLQRGEAQIALDLSPEDVLAVAARDELAVATSADLRVLGLRFNLRAGPLATAPALRQALIAAYDVGALLAAVGGVDVLEGPLPPWTFGMRMVAPTSVRPTASGAFSGASAIRLTAAHLDGVEAHRRAALEMRRAAATLGVEITLRAMRFPDFAASTGPAAEGAPDIWVVESAPEFPDPDAIAFPCWHSQSAGAWRNPAYASKAADALIQAAREVAEPERRVALYDELQRVVAADAPGVFGVVMPWRVGAARRISGLTHAPGMGEGLDFLSLRIG